MSERHRTTRTLKGLSRRTLEELGTLQARVRKLGVHRNTALRLFIVSRYAATAVAQRDFWLEFAEATRQYHLAVRRLAEFCTAHHQRS
jgi:hypothetical protein